MGKEDGDWFARCNLSQQRFLPFESALRQCHICAYTVCVCVCLSGHSNSETTEANATEVTSILHTTASNLLPHITFGIEKCSSSVIIQSRKVFTCALHLLGQKKWISCDRLVLAVDLIKTKGHFLRTCYLLAKWETMQKLTSWQLCWCAYPSLIRRYRTGDGILYQRLKKK